MIRIVGKDLGLHVDPSGDDLGALPCDLDRAPVGQRPNAGRLPGSDAAVGRQREPWRNQARDGFAVLANSGVRCQGISGGKAEIVCDVQIVEHDAAVHRSIPDPNVYVAEGRRMSVGDPRRRHQHEDGKTEAEGDAPGALDRHAVFASHGGILTAAAVAPQVHNRCAGRMSLTPQWGLATLGGCPVARGRAVSGPLALRGYVGSRSRSAF